MHVALGCDLKDKRGKLHIYAKQEDQKHSLLEWEGSLVDINSDEEQTKIWDKLSPTSAQANKKPKPQHILHHAHPSPYPLWVEGNWCAATNLAVPHL